MAKKAKSKNRFDAKRKAKPARMSLAKGASKGTRKALARRVPKGAKSKGRKTLPAQQTLPDASFEQVRNRKLDAATHGLAEVRATTAQAAADERDYKTAALREMVARGIDTYVANGIRLDRVKGADKISVHVAKDQESTTPAPRRVPLDEADPAADGDGEVLDNEANVEAFGTH